MKTLIVLFLATYSLCAADRKITWSPDTSELSWTSSTDGKTKFVVNFRTRLMTANGKNPQRFGEAEQLHLVRYLMSLEAYTLQSEDWHPDPDAFDRQHERKQIEKDADRQNRQIVLRRSR
jgi:hypothetical protein